MLGASQYSSLKSLSARNPETASMVANAVLADRLITRLCPDGGVFVDVGAHIGSIFSAAHANGRNLTIHAIEADPDKAKSLAQRFAYVTLHACAVGEGSGQIEFYRNLQATGYNSLVQDDTAEQVAIWVEIKTLDTLLADVAPDVMKIDIEGAELGALRGGAGVIGAHRPTIMFESTQLGTNSLGYSPELLWEWFSGQGYGIYVPDRVAHGAPPMALETFLDGHEYPMRTLNYFAVHGDRRLAVRDRARTILGVRAT